MRRQVCGLRQRFRRALGTRRADGKLKLFLCPRAHAQIQTDVQTERRDRKTVWAEHRVGVRRPNVSRETIGKKDCSTLSPLYARLNHRRKAAGFILRMFRLSEHRPRGVDAMFRSSRLNLSKSAKEGETVFDTETRAQRRILFHPIKPSFSAKTKSRPCRNAGHIKPSFPHRTSSRPRRTSPEKTEKSLKNAKGGSSREASSPFWDQGLIISR